MIAYTDGIDMSESTVDKIGSGPAHTSSEEDNYHLKNDDEKRTKESTSSDTRIPTMTDITKKVTCNVFGDVPVSKSVTSDTLTSSSRNTILVKDAEKPARLENGFSCERKNPPTETVDEQEQVNTNLTSKEGGCLKIALEHCERR